MSTKSDLRSTTRPNHRTLAAKAKWAHGASSRTRGRSSSQPRPARPHEHLTHPNPRVSGSALKAACASRQDMHDAEDEYPTIARHLPGASVSPHHLSEAESSGADDDGRDEKHREALITGASVDHAPSSGSQILSGALAKAIEAFEDRETDRLVRAEWSVLDDEGEEVGFSPARAKRGKGSRVEGEEDYEMV